MERSSKTCTTPSTSNIVNAVVPRTAQWPDLVPASYAKDGLIQSIGTVTICDRKGVYAPSCATTNTAVIDMPQNCGNDENVTPSNPNGNQLTPALFVYPLLNALYSSDPTDKNGYTLRQNYPGVYISVKVNPSNAQQWLITAGGNGDTSHSISIFDHFAVAYFTVCKPAKLQTGSWALTYGTT